jgi:HlyD family secretion protein
VVTYTVIIEAANGDRKLFPGMTATAQIEAAKKENVLRLANDVLRYKPKDATLTSGHDGNSSERTNRLIERLKGEVALTPDQEKALRDALAKFSDETKSSQPSGGMGGPPVDPSAMRQRVMARVEQTLQPLLTAEQKTLYERYKKGREGTRGVTVWVLEGAGAPEARFVRLGLSDGQFTEILNGDVAAGANLVVRAKEPAK